MSRPMRRIWIAGGLLTVALGIQLIPVAVPRSPRSRPALNAPTEVVSILKRSCFDCHSNETRWPWYSRLAPASWLIARDVRNGRDQLNFSEWDEFEPEDLQDFKQSITEVVSDGTMPPWFYLPLHPDASLSEADKAVLDAWYTGSAEPSALAAGD